MGLPPHRIEPSVAAGTSARVGAILTRAEARAESILAESDRVAEALGRAALEEAAWVAREALQTAESAARERVRRMLDLRDSIAGRGGSPVEGLAGGELTAVRLEEVVAALGRAAERMMEEVLGEPLAAAGREPPERANGDDEAQPYYGALPDGAPMARRPSRTDGPRAAELLHELFGRADSPT